MSRSAFSGPLRVADTALAPRPRASLSLVADFLGGGASWVSVPPAGLPRRVGRERKRIWDLFTATPAPLVESWRVARHLEAATEAGDTVLVTDAEGVGGMFALEQSLLPVEVRRNVVVVAADSVVLEFLAVAGTIGGVPDDVAHVVDWELVAYRWAAAVAATSQQAVDLLARLGVVAGVAVEPAPPAPAGDVGAPQVVRVPEPVSRIARSGEVLRGLAGAGAEVVVSDEDRPDHVWSGTTWDALGGVRALHGDAIRRAAAADADLVVLGDPFAVPGPELEARRAAGGAVLVAAGSAAAARWSDAPTWSTEDDLAAAVAGERRALAVSQTGLAPAARCPAPDRARRVSAGVPVFRDVSHLDECVQSLLDQQQALHEIVIVDDGSRSPAVTAALEGWRAGHPDLVRTLALPVNRGVSAARNAVLEQMTGDAFVFVDGDDTLDPRFVAECADALRADERLWAVATWTEFFGSYQGIEAKPPFDRRVGARENPIVSTAALVDMRVRDAGIRFAPDLAFVFCEDWEVWSQIVAAGGAFGLVPAPLARHRVHTESGGFQRTELAHSLGKARAVAPLDGQ